MNVSRYVDVVGPFACGSIVVGTSRGNSSCVDPWVLLERRSFDVSQPASNSC